MGHQDAKSLWLDARGDIQRGVGTGAWRSYFLPAEPERLEGDIFTLSVPAGLIKKKIETDFLEILRRALTESAGYDIDVTVEVCMPKDFSVPSTALEPTPELVSQSVEITQAFADEPLPSFEPDEPLPRTPPPPLPERRDASGGGDNPGRINPGYTFDTFVIGDANRFAHTAAMAVAESPGEAYNPLFIYGDTGLGKTHLLHAIANMVQQLTTLRVTYTTSEQFTNEFISMIRNSRGRNGAGGSHRERFRERYRDTDVLLIDDIQFIAGREETQNEFFHVFNDLHSAYKQIVLVSDRRADEIPGLSARLVSRFQSGIPVDVQPPGLETRIAILRLKAEVMGMSIPPDALELIASRIDSNIRKLEGTLNIISAHAKLYQQPIDIETVQDHLDRIGETSSRRVTADLILQETSAYYQVSLEELLGSSRRQQLVHARHVSMYMLRDLTDLSFPGIGRLFERDHTTVMHACRKITEKMSNKRQVLAEVEDLGKRIKQASA